ncbi:hypothetical protein DUNSADRAFT_7655 [Dunaliella salina]|uniref:Chlorophyllase n=1 Tax=Dunaliella salina TaxID=3046 RepID=A0ABQ7H697_DUNSA|nr:hypothetical protein DUNSADRAFT_7655 [Dunaliella salina]|eukprot:KAF5842341.1 hypothetical protein DUNSADRAFT_7655 [Dunaliella salina]
MGACFCLLLLMMWGATMDSGGEAFTDSVQSVSRDLEVHECGGRKACKLNLMITFYSGLPAAPVPVVLFLTGFQMPRSWYNSYAEQLASNGRYLVVQYETSSSIVKPLIPDQIEVQFFPQLLSFVAGEASDSASPLYNRADVSRVGLMGHSRGAKLAALALASGVVFPHQTLLAARTQQRLASTGGPDGVGRDHGAEKKCHQQQQQQKQQVQLAAVLVDPVDSGSGSSAQDLQFPSAAEALAGQNRSAAVIGAGICGWCNPTSDGWRKFWPVLQSGWLQVVTAAGHLQFTDAKGATAWAWDKFCGGGALSHAEVQEFPVRAALAWFGLAFEDKPPNRYIDWSRKQQERASFEVKTAETWDCSSSLSAHE